jgi:hypothetical protein
MADGAKANAGRCGSLAAGALARLLCEFGIGLRDAGVMARLDGGFGNF